MQWFTIDERGTPTACEPGTKGAWAIPAADFAKLWRFTATDAGHGVINRVRVTRAKDQL